MKKFYDTCSLLELQSAILEDDFLISNISLTELENIKTSTTKDEEIKYRARQVLHLLHENEDKYKVIIYIEDYDTLLKKHMLPITNDSKIIISALVGFERECGLDEGIFITHDLACKTLAKGLGLQTLYLQESQDDGYTGYITVCLNDAELADFYSNVLPNHINKFDLLVNQYLLIEDKEGKIIDKYKYTANNEYVEVKYRMVESDLFGQVKPRNQDIYQTIALDSLASNQITMLRGPAGSGKSYLAFGHMFSLLEQGKISKIVIFCNTVATKGSAKLGFYPGSRTEKLLDSQIGNLLESKLGGDRILVEKLIEDGSLVLLPMSDIRGYDTSGMNAAVYISEAQNLDIELMKLALQRIGNDSICILDGDSNAQVDLSMYAGSKNGMRRVSQVFRGSDIYGEVTLVNIHRSKIAELAQQL